MSTSIIDELKDQKKKADEAKAAAQDEGRQADVEFYEGVSKRLEKEIRVLEREAEKEKDDEDDEDEADDDGAEEEQEDEGVYRASTVDDG